MTYTPPPAFQPVSFTRSDYEQDYQGQKTQAIIQHPAWDFDQVMAFLASPRIQLRLVDSIEAHQRPPLAGIIRELESLVQPEKIPDSELNHARMNQVIGIAVRILMGKLGYERTDKTTSLQTLSTWFSRVPYYQRKSDGSSPGV